MGSPQGIPHAIIHADYHAGRVRIVRNEEVEQASADLRLLFPHDSILSTSIGCCHTCLYTSDAPVSMVAERIAEHIREFDHTTGERRTPAAATAKEGLGKQVWQ